MTSIHTTEATRDTGRIRVGAAFRLLTPAAQPAALPPSALPTVELPAEVADSGRIRVGAAFRLLARA